MTAVRGARAPAGRAHPAHGSAPSPGWPAWSAGPSAATTPSNRPRTVLESSSNRPRRIRPGSPKDPTTVPADRAHPAHGSAPSPGWPAWSAGPSAATTPSNRPRIVLESSSNRPRTVLEPSPRVPASFPEGSGHRPHRSRSPLARLGALARLAGVVRRPFRRHDALESSSNRPRTVLEGSGQLPARIWPAPPTRSRSPTPRGGRPSGRRPAFQNQPPPTTRFAA
jgi:hypothetical protein